MAEYKKNSAKNTMNRFELPSTPGAEVYLPTRLGYGARIRVRSAAYKVHVEQGEDGEDRIFQTVDPAAAERELLIQALLDPRTYHNLTNDGKPIVFNRPWIESEMDEDDALYLGAMLMNEMQEEIGVPLEDEQGESLPVRENGTTLPESGSPREDSAPVKKPNSKEKRSSEHTLVETK